MAIEGILSRNNVREVGAGTPLLFAHGYGCDQSVWRHITPAFADYRVILFDHVGFGASDLSAFSKYKYRTLRGYAEDIVEICRALELRDVTLVGHSVSGVIGALATQLAPELFSALIMIAPSPCYIDHGDYVGGFTREDIEGLLRLLDSNHLGWSNQVAPVIMGNPERPELSEELRDSFCRTDPEVARYVGRLTFLANNIEDMAKIPVRSLTLQCTQDSIAPQSVGDYMHRIMQQNTLKLMAATGHCPHLSAPEETVAAIRAFLKGKD